MPGPKILIYSHDTFGLGHLRRCRAIAQALVARFSSAEIILLSGSPIIGRFDFPERVDFVRLPGVMKLSCGDYVPRSRDLALADAIRLRMALIEQAAESFAPDLVLVDKEPLGLRGEMRVALEKLKARRVRVVLGLRDILDDPETLAPEWRRKGALPAIAALYDEVWVFGRREVYDPLAGLPLTPEIERKIVFTGYLKRDVPARPDPLPDPGITKGPFLLVTTGGGGDGDGLIDWVLSAYESAARPSLPALLVLGPFMAKARRHAFRARAAKRTDVALITFDAYLENIESRALGVAAMGGYNTFCEILSLAKPALIVPREHPRREQLIRAGRAQALHLAQLLRDPAERGEPRDPAVMAKALASLPARPSPALTPGLLDGLPIVLARTEALLGAKAERRAS